MDVRAKQLCEDLEGKQAAIAARRAERDELDKRIKRPWRRASRWPCACSQVCVLFDQKRLQAWGGNSRIGTQEYVVPTEKLRALRMKYKAAYAAHQAWAMRIAEVAMAGERPSDTLQDDERKAAGELAKAREELRVAIAEAVAEKV